MAATDLTIFSPAKLNLFLAITGRRADGFHELVSVVAPLDFGDSLALEIGAGDAVTLVVDDPAVPSDGTNLILKAAAAYRAATGWRAGVRFRLTKRIPMGAGLGGGSSNAAAALRLLNRAADDRLAPAQLAQLAATLGSDCPLFLQDGPVVMRGRGEQLSPLPADAVARLKGRRVIVFKPAFGVPTAWAYGRMVEAAAGGTSWYVPPEVAERRLAAWVQNPQARPEELLFNNMEPAAFGKFLALPVLLDGLARDFGLAPRMTGSGSACFAFLPDDADVQKIRTAIRNGWGEAAFVVEARL